MAWSQVYLRSRCQSTASGPGRARNMALFSLPLLCRRAVEGPDFAGNTYVGKSIVGTRLHTADFAHRDSAWFTGCSLARRWKWTAARWFDHFWTYHHHCRLSDGPNAATFQPTERDAALICSQGRIPVKVLKWPPQPHFRRFLLQTPHP